MSGRTYLRAIVPIGLLYSASLVCSNMVYLYLSVAFIQMLKAAAPVAVLLVAWTWGVEEPSLKRFLNILLIVCGVGLASAGEINFSFLGFMFQVGGIVFEAMRLIMIQVLLSGDDQKMDPLVSLYYYAPVCAVMNVMIAIPSELGKFDVGDLKRVGLGLLVLNALVAFLLNVSSVFLVSFTGFNSLFSFLSLVIARELGGLFTNIKNQIGKTSGLVMTLTGILKNILLVVAAVMMWHTPITALQGFGYTIALAGLLYYSLGWDQIVAILTTAGLYTKGVWEQVTGTGTGEDATGRLPSAVRRALVTGLTALIIVVLVGGFLYGGEPDEQLGIAPVR